MRTAQERDVYVVPVGIGLGVLAGILVTLRMRPRTVRMDSVGAAV